MSDSPHPPHSDLPREVVCAESRVGWVDIAKGGGIFLVVFGHTLRGLTKSGVMPPDWGFVDSWIYAFHMPLFFFLSGLFVEGSLRKNGFGRYFDSKLRRIVWPYFVWSVLQEIIRHFSKSSHVPLSDMWRILYQPVMQFWFLYVIFLILVLYGLWRKCGASPISFVLLVVVSQIVVSLGLPLGYWGVLCQVYVYAPFFALGVLVTDKALLAPLRSMRTSTLLLLSLAGFLLLTGLVSFPLNGLSLLFIVKAVVGIAATVLLSALLPGSPTGRLLNILGIFSLEIYVAHSIFSAAIRPLVLHLGFHSMAVQMVAGIVVGLFGPLLLCFLCRRFAIPFVFSFPERSCVKAA